jgi:hypothetical protein
MPSTWKDAEYVGCTKPQVSYLKKTENIARPNAKEVIRELAEDAKKLPESMTLEFCRPCYVALRILL